MTPWPRWPEDVDRRRAAGSRAGDRPCCRFAAAGQSSSVTGDRRAPAGWLPRRHRHRRRAPRRAARRALPAVRVTGRRSDPVRGWAAPLRRRGGTRHSQDRGSAGDGRRRGDVGRRDRRRGPALRRAGRSRTAAHRRRAGGLGPDGGAAAAVVRSPREEGAVAADVGGRARRSSRRASRRPGVPRRALRRVGRAAVAPGGDAPERRGRRPGRRRRCRDPLGPAARDAADSPAAGRPCGADDGRRGAGRSRPDPRRGSSLRR